MELNPGRAKWFDYIGQRMLAIRLILEKVEECKYPLVQFNPQNVFLFGKTMSVEEYTGKPKPDCFNPIYFFQKCTPEVVNGIGREVYFLGTDYEGMEVLDMPTVAEGYLKVVTKLFT